MIKITEQSKVYVYAPLNVTTGGAELLHQLVHILNTNDVEAYVVYFHPEKWIIDGEIPIEYSKYCIKTTKKIEDTPNNIVVIYEGIFNHVCDTKQAQLILWWLSVDNFYICSKSFLSIIDGISWNKFFGIKQILSRIKDFMFKKKTLFSSVSIKKLKELDALHCYQSEYSQNFLLNQGFRELLPLSDYINTNFVKNDLEKQYTRENKILYNPKKGFKYTQKIIKSTPDLTWIPLVGMTREELIYQFKTSKLYIDFGYHPGKDRIPREAVLGGCCILTNLNGSARFFEDVAINVPYKIDTSKTKISDVINRIQFILDNYDQLDSDFNFYRNRVLNEENIFKRHVLDIFKQ